MRIIVRAVEEREECVAYIKKYLPTAEILFDTTRNAMKTFLAAMVLANGEPSVHMEEDIYITENFIDKINAAILERPSEVIQFFSMRGADIKIGSRYECGRTFMMNQCFYLPENYSTLIYNYYPSWPQKDYHKTGYDILIADFLKSRKEKYFIYVPSLVQHRIGRSVINSKRPNKRQSMTFIDGIYDESDRIETKG